MNERGRQREREREERGERDRDKDRGKLAARECERETDFESKNSLRLDLIRESEREESVAMIRCH